MLYREPVEYICRRRNFKVRFIAHNIDTDYRCCESVVTVMLGRS